MKRYPINKEYRPLDRFIPPTSRLMIFLSQKFMRIPTFFKIDKELDISKITLDGYKDEKFDLYILNKKDSKDKSPCLIFFHGGGFIFDGSKNHYYLANRYAKECNCKVIYVKYNLAPNYPFPYPQIEAYKATQYVFEHSEELNIDINRIGLVGDSAGATLALSSLLIAKEEYNKIYNPLFTLLIYPWLDGRGVSSSNKKYRDTPMWNYKLSVKVSKYNNPDNINFPNRYNSIIENNNLSILPNSYIEVAEFDALHDDGIIYSEILKKYHKEVELIETKGTMHGYDTKYKVPTTQKLIKRRIEYINKMFTR